MQISPIQQNQNYNKDFNTSFSALKKVQCWRQVEYGCLCTSSEKRIMNELKDLAKVNDFFKNSDVKAVVTVVRGSGAKIILSCKPVAKKFIDKIKNFILSPQLYVISDTHICPDDSSYYLSKKLREVKEGKQDFSSIIT
jgi:hypothetical protein